MFGFHAAWRRRPRYVRVSRSAIGIARNFREALERGSQMANSYPHPHLNPLSAPPSRDPGEADASAPGEGRVHPKTITDDDPFMRPRMAEV